MITIKHNIRLKLFAILIILAFPIAVSAEENWDLRKASGTGDIITVKKLLSAGVNPNIKGYGGSTPLHYAAARGHSTIVQVLIDFGANVNAKDDKGGTALIYACGRGILI